MHTGTQEEFSSVQTQPSAQVPEKAVSRVRNAPSRQEKATGPTVKLVLVETGKAEQLSCYITRGCRSEKAESSDSQSRCARFVCKMGGWRGVSDCAFYLRNDRRIRHIV